MLLDVVYNNFSSSRNPLGDALKALSADLHWEGNETQNPTLFNYGCRGDWDTLNCTSICSDPNSTFGNICTLANCVAYPWISQLISDGNLTTRGQAIANQFNILSNTSHPGVTTAIIKVQNECWNQWIIHADFSQFSFDSPEWSGLCGGDYSSVGTVSTDIGGIGVMFINGLSYHDTS